MTTTEETLQTQVKYLQRQVHGYWDLVEAGKRVIDAQTGIIVTQEKEITRLRKELTA